MIIKTLNSKSRRLPVLGLTVVLLFFSGLLVGCGAVGESTSASQVEANEPVGTSGRLISIQSDNVQAAGYDANSSIMTVRFNNGYTYEYYGITAELWDSFIAAQPDPWSQVGYPQLVQAGVPYKRIN